MKFEYSILPRVAQEAAFASAAGREILAWNPFLDADIFKRMLKERSSKSRIRFMAKNITLSRAVTMIKDPRLLEDLRSKTDSFMFPDLGVEIARTFSKQPLSRRSHRLLLNAEVPVFANIVLGHPLSSREDNLKAAPVAYRAARVRWLAGKDSSDVSDEVAWSLISAADTFEDVWVSSSYGDRMRTGLAHDLAYLLHKRPGLRDYAVRTPVAVVLYSASLVELTATQQMNLLMSYRALKADDDGLDYFYSKLKSHYHASPATPIQNLAAAPWCAPETIAFLSKFPKEFKVRVLDDGTCEFDSGYSYQMNTLFNPAKLSRVDLTQAPAEEVHAWLDHYHAGSDLLNAFLALKVLDRKDLDPKTVSLRRELIKWKPRLVDLVNLDRKRQIKPAPHADKMDALVGWVWMTSDPAEMVDPASDETIRPYVNLELGVRQAGWQNEHLIICALRDAELTKSEWEVVFPLLDNFEGTLSELIAVARDLA